MTIWNFLACLVEICKTFQAKYIVFTTNKSRLQICFETTSFAFLS